MRQHIYKDKEDVRAFATRIWSFLSKPEIKEDQMHFLRKIIYENHPHKNLNSYNTAEGG